LAGKRKRTDLDWPDEFEMDDGWEEEEEDMPDEDEADDTGWLPGPAKREMPTFKGATPGPTDAELNEESWAQDIMHGLITPEFKDLSIEYTCQHAEAWRDEHADWKSNRIEQSMLEPRKVLTHGSTAAAASRRARAARARRLHRALRGHTVLVRRHHTPAAAPARGARRVPGGRR
jgi:hypothetical protein